MFIPIERFDLSREFIYGLESDIDQERLSVGVALYQIGPDYFRIVRHSYTSRTKKAANGMPEMGDNVQDYSGDFRGRTEAFDAFSSQCVKAFTHQVTWHNKKSLALKEV